MYFVRYQPLKEKLKTRSLTDREALPYFIIFLGLASLFALLPKLHDFNTWDWVGGGLSFALAIAGIFYAYAQNGGNQGFDIIQKCIVLGWVVGVRCFLVFIPILCVLYFVAIAVFNLSIDETSWFDVLLIAGFEIVFYQRLGRHIKDTR